MMKPKKKNDMALFIPSTVGGAPLSVVVRLGGVIKKSKAPLAEENEILVRESIEWRGGEISTAPVSRMQFEDDVHFESEGVFAFGSERVTTEWAE